jgi:hypothetical protein
MGTTQQERVTTSTNSPKAKGSHSSTQPQRKANQVLVTRGTTLPEANLNRALLGNLHWLLPALNDLSQFWVLLSPQVETFTQEIRSNMGRNPRARLAPTRLGTYLIARLQAWYKKAAPDAHVSYFSFSERPKAIATATYCTTKDALSR